MNALQVATAKDLNELSELMGHAFAFPAADGAPWFERLGLDQVRLLRDSGRIVAALGLIPMGHFFGGASVPSWGVCGVSVATDVRGTGVGKTLMAHVLAELRSRRVPLSSLYPATVPIYQRVGYERAGARFRLQVAPHTLRLPREPQVVWREVEGTPDVVRELYREFARRENGYLDRGPYVWTRVHQPRGMTTKTFTASADGVLEGYVVLSHKSQESLKTEVIVTDLAATTSRAARAVLRLLGEYRSLATSVRWFGGPADVFARSLPERHVDIQLNDYLMVRIVDVAAALAARSYAKCVSCTFSLEVEDELLPENRGVYRVAVEEGKATVDVGGRREGTPHAVMTVRGLAALYTGFATPEGLRQTGDLSAAEDALGVLSGAFGGPLPTLRDMF